MQPQFLIPETTANASGSGPVIDLGAASGKLLQLTLGITRIVEQESLDITVWGSPDGTAWGDKPILKFPQKFYCGTYALTLDLSDHPDIRQVRVDYKMSRWGRSGSAPLFGFYVFAQEVAQPAFASVA